LNLLLLKHLKKFDTKEVDIS